MAYLTVLDYNDGSVSIYKMPTGADAETWITENTTHKLDEIYYMISMHTVSIHIVY